MVVVRQDLAESRVCKMWMWLLLLLSLFLVLSCLFYGLGFFVEEVHWFA